MTYSNKDQRLQTSAAMDAVPDLLSFDSWDYSTSDEECGSLLSTGTAATTPSMDDETVSSTILTTICHDHSSTCSKHIHLSVSGVIFSVSPFIFERLEKLPWQWPGNDGASNRFFYLLTSPDIFEMLLNFIMFGSVPSLSKMSASDIEELEPMAAVLELYDLQRHLEKKNHASSYRRASAGGGSLRRHNRQNQQNHHRPDSIFMETKNIRTMASSSSTSHKTGPVRAMRAAWTNRRLSSEGQSPPPLRRLKPKRTHEEVCASSDWIY